MAWTLFALTATLGTEGIFAVAGSDTTSLPGWVLTSINLGMLGVNFYLYLTRRQVTPGEMEGRLKDQREQYEARIKDLQELHKVSEVAADARINQERERADRNEQKLAEAHQLIAREMTPAMVESAHALDRSNDLWQGIVKENMKRNTEGGA